MQAVQSRRNRLQHVVEDRVPPLATVEAVMIRSSTILPSQSASDIAQLGPSFPGSIIAESVSRPYSASPGTKYPGTETPTSSQSDQENLSLESAHAITDPDSATAPKSPAAAVTSTPGVLKRIFSREIRENSEAHPRQGPTKAHDEKIPESGKATIAAAEIKIEIKPNFPDTTTKEAAAVGKDEVTGSTHEVFNNETGSEKSASWILEDAHIDASQIPSLR